MEKEQKFTVVVIGERGLWETVKRCLAEEDRIEIVRAGSEEKALESIEAQAPELVVIDFDLLDFKPLKFLTNLFTSGERREMVVVAANPTIESVVKCMQLGVREFIQFPKDSQKLHDMLKHIYSQWQKSQQGATFQAQQHHSFDVSGLIGQSAQMRQVIELIRRVVTRRWVTVLIRGETGTGKEVVARAIHYGSTPFSPNAAFVEVNCTAIPENLLEAELFGYEKGAFTDAKFSKKGLFELAEGGTLFLDEIGDMSLVLQAKLLKAIEEKRFRRLGSTQSIQVKTRIMTGTHADLERCIEEGKFRRDLYYRLNVITIPLPPLRERGEDILLLARHFIEKYADEYQTPARELSPEAEAILMSYDWPGNVRELQHVIERAVLLGDGPVIDLKELQEALGILPQPKMVMKAPSVSAWGRAIEIPPEGLSLKQGECKLIEEILRLTKGNKTRASQILGISRPRLGRKLEEYKIDWTRSVAEAH